MKITDVKIRYMNNAGKMKAVVSIIIDNAFAIHDIKIIKGRKGLFLAMPNRYGTDGVHRDIAHPVDPIIRKELQNLILNKYYEHLELYLDNSCVD